MEVLRTTLAAFIFCYVNVCVCVLGSTTPTVYSIYPADVNSISDYDGRLKVEAELVTTVLLVGKHFDELSTQVFFTPDKGCYQKGRKSKHFDVTNIDSERTSGYVDVELRKLQVGEEFYFICLRTKNNATWTHQGHSSWLSLSVFEPLPIVSPYILPLPLQIAVVSVLLLTF